MLYEARLQKLSTLLFNLGKLPDKSRKVLEITEIEGYHDGRISMNPLFQYKVGTSSHGNGESAVGILAPTGNRLKNTLKLERNGMNA